MAGKKSGYVPLGFREARGRAVAALTAGSVIEHEAREALNEKNLLAIGEVSCEDVAFLLKRCLGTQHYSSPHNCDAATEVHVFKPIDSQGDQWYIKLYFRKATIFISVHRSR